MKPEELSIGDWVNVNRAENVAEGRYIEWQEIDMVVAISECFVSVRYGDDEFDWEEVSMDAVEPIPITPEILEKNGFRLKEEGETHTKYVSGDEHSIIAFVFYKESIYDVDTVLDCELGFVGGLNRIHHCHVKYVHELQHTLRLCKINKTIEL